MNDFSTQQQQQYYNAAHPSTTSSSSSMIGRVEASIMAESALIDRETGRVFWEGGDSNTLYESLVPKLDQFGVEHVQATILSTIITVAILGVLMGWLRRVIIDETLFYNNNNNNDKISGMSSSSSKIISILVMIAEWTIFKLPKIENKWLVVICVMLYLLESYNCSTRRFLSNTISSSTELDQYIEKLREEDPIVTWTVKAFHYEYRKLFLLPRLILRSILRSGNKEKGGEESSSFSTTSAFELPLRRNPRHVPPSPPFTRKIITNEAASTYKYRSCIDDTMVGLWTRALINDDDTTSTEQFPPFTKIALTKLLILTDRRTREDYFQQQSNFVTDHGRGDEFVEFSTNIEVGGYRPRILAVRRNFSSRNRLSMTSKLFRLHLFWAFTLLGLTVPYRVWFKRHCDFVRVTIIKETSSSSSSSGSKSNEKRSDDTDSSSSSSSYWAAVARSWFPGQASIRPKVGEAIFGKTIYNDKPNNE